MKFADIIGQTAVKKHLITAVEQGKVSQAYIISGEKGSGKKMMAEAFAAYLLCQHEPRGGDACGECPSCRKLEHGNHPDVIYVTHEKTQITVDDIREQVTGTVDIRPYESEKKVYIIDEAQKMNIEAQNAILKTLENPPLPEKTIEKYLMSQNQLPDYMARLYAMFAQGNLGKAVTAATDEEFRSRRAAVVDLAKGIAGEPYYSYAQKAENVAADKEGADEYLDLLSLWYRDVLLYKAVGADDRLCYSDEAFTIRRIAGSMSYERLNRLFEAVDTSRSKLKANVRADLVFTDLFGLMAGK